MTDIGWVPLLPTGIAPAGQAGGVGQFRLPQQPPQSTAAASGEAAARVAATRMATKVFMRLSFSRAMHQLAVGRLVCPRAFCWFWLPWPCGPMGEQGNGCAVAAARRGTAGGIDS